jgi:hypothetical protein
MEAGMRTRVRSSADDYLRFIDFWILLTGAAVATLAASLFF